MSRGASTVFPPFIKNWNVGGGVVGYEYTFSWRSIPHFCNVEVQLSYCCKTLVGDQSIHISSRPVTKQCESCFTIAGLTLNSFIFKILAYRLLVSA